MTIPSSILISIALWVVVGLFIGIVIFLERKRHPRALFVLFFTEMWERFSYYGMRGLLTLYLVEALGYADKDAYGIYAAYGAFVYASPILGGFLADKYLGYKNAIILGGTLMMLGHFFMAIPTDFFFFSALAFLIMGNGFFKPNISSLVGEFYEKNEEKRDAAFSIFYMGINVGAFLTQFTCGTIGKLYGWHYGFGTAGIGMLIGLIIFLSNLKYMKGKGIIPPQYASLKFRLVPSIWFLAIITTGAVYLIMRYGRTSSSIIQHLVTLLSGNTINVQEISVVDIILGGTAFITLSYLIIYAIRKKGTVLKKTMVLFIFMICSIVFWALFEQAGSSINLFTERNVNREIGGFTIPTPWFQSVNPGLIILLAPFFSIVWEYLAIKGKEPSVPVKFGLGLIQLALGFIVLYLSQNWADQNGLTPMIFLLIGYFLHTTGELCLSPVGLSTVTRLAPYGFVAIFMGFWFMSSSIAHWVGGVIAKKSSADKTDTYTFYLENQTYVIEGHIPKPSPNYVLIPSRFRIKANNLIIASDQEKQEILSGKGKGNVNYTTWTYKFISSYPLEQGTEITIEYGYYDKKESLLIYCDVFREVSYWAFALGLIMILFAPLINKLMKN